MEESSYSWTDWELMLHSYFQSNLTQSWAARHSPHSSKAFPKVSSFINARLEFHEDLSSSTDASTPERRKLKSNSGFHAQSILFAWWVPWVGSNFSKSGTHSTDYSNALRCLPVANCTFSLFNSKRQPQSVGRNTQPLQFTSLSFSLASASVHEFISVPSFKIP